jgi:hypothetical protein
MSRMLLLLGCLLSLVFSATAQDTDDALDSITVTGSRVGYGDLLDTPAVSLTKSLFTISAYSALHREGLNHRTRGTASSLGHGSTSIPSLLLVPRVLWLSAKHAEIVNRL